MRTLIWILVIGILLYFIYKKIKEGIGNIKLKVRLGNIRVGKFIKIIVAEKGQVIPGLETEALVIIENNNNYSIPIKNLYIEIYDKQTLIGRTTEITKERVIIPRNTVSSLSHFIDIYPVQAFFDVLKNLKSGDKIKLNYRIKLNVFSITIPFKGEFEYQQE